MTAREVFSRRLIAIGVVLAASVLPVASAFAQTPTFVRSDYPLATNDLIAADLNGDGRPDLAGIAAGGAAVLLGNGDGTFQPIVTYPVFSWSQALIAGDFNSDGHLDLMVTINDVNIGLSLLTGRGDGTFNPAVHFPNVAGFDAPAIAADDLDNDGKLDLVIGHNAACYTVCVISKVITVMRGNGDGTFQPARVITVGSSTDQIAIGDFNRDGIKDLGLASSAARVLLLLGVGDATFVQQPTLTLLADTGFVNASDIDVADFNRDTIQDLVVAIASNGSRTAILIGNGDGTFQAPSIITEPEIRVPQFQAVADYNGDGFQDLAMALGYGSNGLMEIRNGNGDGTFGPLVLYLQPPPLSSIGGIHIITADFNGDGKPDIALNYGGASAGVVALRNTTGTAPAVTLSSVTVSPSTVVGGGSSTATIRLSGAAPAGGAVVALSSSSNAATVPGTVTVPAGSTSRAATITTIAVTASTPATVSAVYKGVTRSTTLTVTPATPSAPSLISPANQATVALPVTLDWSDVSGAASYLIHVDDSSTFPAPRVVEQTVAASQLTVTSLAARQHWWRVRGVNSAGTAGSWSLVRSFTPQGAATPTALSAMSVNPTSVVGGNGSQGTVTLTAAAPSGGFVVTLSDNSSAGSAPASVTVAQGTTSATFAIATTTVTASTPVTITAAAGTVTRTATLTVTPAGQNATLTVTATGRSGERVTSSPTGINVAVGSSGSASFTSGTSITLSVSNGRDAIWSGACSSGGNKRRTCTFTLNAAASVTANVQ
jgi:hypothetical protein